MTQEVLLVIPGAGGESTGRRVFIEEDTTAGGLLRAANLNPGQWGLEIKQGQETISLAQKDKLSQYVQAGDKVFGVPTDLTVGPAA